MRHLFFVKVVFIISITFSFAQAGGQLAVPNAVVSTLHEKFHDVKDLEWSLKRENLYKARFSKDNVVYRVYINSKGELLMCRYDVLRQQLPSGIQAQIKQAYSDYHIDVVQKVEFDGKIYYRLELENGAGDRKVFMQP